MFTLDQILQAHAKVKSGADFPKYIQDIIRLGVTGYEAFAADGHTIYYGSDHFQIASGAKFSEFPVMDEVNMTQFREDLKATQQGKTDYPTFCRDSAKSGINKWRVDTARLTCTYFDKKENALLEEKIPS